MPTFNHQRKIDAPPAHVFAAISNPKRLEKWGGPAGFSNTFEICDFKVGGSWVYTMHGPDGKNYDNKSVFTEIETNKKVVIQHESLPQYKLVISLADMERGTLVTWSQTFEKPEVAKALAHIVEPANEQNLDRLSKEVFNGLG
jgi:uncharacterized protein YndB with AHSA1/START domain